jgi:putative FmdB family regulatory protein
MPIYEYTCRKCNAHVEVMQKISDKPLARHAKCGGKLEKEWSRTGFQFKGTGWYVTDYAGKKSDAKEGKDRDAVADKSASSTEASSSTESSKETSKETSKDAGVKETTAKAGVEKSKGKKGKDSAAGA